VKSIAAVLVREGGLRGDSQLIGSPRLTAFPVQSSRQVTCTGQVATTFGLIAPSLGDAGSEFAIATEYTAVNHAHRYRRHCGDRKSCLHSLWWTVIVMLVLPVLPSMRWVRRALHSITAASACPASAQSQFAAADTARLCACK